MAFFSKKYCDICDEKIGLLGNKKLIDGNMCKNCAGLLSPHFTNRRKTSLEDIKDHLAYRENNKKDVAAFNATRTIGRNTKVILDEDAGRFIVSSAGSWQNQNPDVIDFSQVTGCQTEIREYKTELKWKDKDGNDVSFSPRRYEIDYDFFVTIEINSPWFNQINFKINDRRVDIRGSVEYREMERQSKEIKETLTQVRQEVRESVVAASAAKTAQTCSFCGATTTPDPRGCCEFCGGAVQG
ncbi:MAG TPA: DUF4428 domain-containing protein [Epulopiscium sp.]|nr:DUF4428 domain-containing protein [Candidatus Epulonipiscium sp.]